MNILFIEDEKELLDTAMSQLMRLGHVVYPAVDIAEAREVLQDESKTVQMVITDHRLPDGLGVHFAIEINENYPQARIAIVSGCLTDEDIQVLKSHDLLYFRKPLLYGKVVEEVRKHYSAKANFIDLSEEESDESDDADDKKKRWGLF